MTTNSFSTFLLSYLIAAPAALLCYLPMKNELRFSKVRVALWAALLLAGSALLAAWLGTRHALDANAVMLPLLALFFLFYRMTLRVPLPKALAVFLLVTALLSILSNYACLYDAAKNPTLGAACVTPDYVLFQLALGVLALLLLAWPFLRYGSELVERLSMDRIWWMACPFSVTILSINLFLRPVKYETLYVNRISTAVPQILTALLLIWALLCVTFYYIVMGILNAARTEERNRILEMEESQYQAQRRYMDSTARARHDFKHTLRTLKGMAEAKDYAALDAYLDEYLKSLPVRDVENYCENSAVNALLNYYAQEAQRQDIFLNLQAELGRAAGVSDVDLCGVLGNILSNAVAACQDLPKGDRWIQLRVTRYMGESIIIVATNSFNGEVRRKDGRYLSTRRKGSGIGLTSIASTAERYGGRAEFYHEGRTFFTNVLIPLPKG